MDKAKAQWSNMIGKFGIGKVLGCGCLGCLVPLGTGALLLVIVGWWLVASPSPSTSPAYRPAPPVTQQRQAPAPLVPTLAPGRNPALPSMMGNQPLHPDYRTEGQADYLPNDLGLPAGLYLGYANARGARRTPYVKGQQLSNGMTVVTGDFDFVLLQDANGTQWYCDPTGTACQWWR